MIITLPAPADQPAHLSLGRASYILNERAPHYYGAGIGALSIKAFFGGRAVFTVGRGRFAREEGAYLVLNHGQPYAITIESEAPVESFCIFFAAGLAEAVRRDLVTPADRLLADPHAPAGAPLHFFEQTYQHDALVSPCLLQIHRAVASGAADPGRLGEQLHGQLGRLLQVHENVYRQVEALPAARPATREELYRRLLIAREYAGASFHQLVTLDDMAAAAYLSPNHLLRSFKQAFGRTPHQYLTDLRLQRASDLLAHTDRTVTEICLAVGFESLGTFSWLFRRRIGVAPAEYRRQNR
jgi:AraC-like DNA-binding protein